MLENFGYVLDAAIQRHSCKCHLKYCVDVWTSNISS